MYRFVRLCMLMAVVVVSSEAMAQSAGERVRITTSDASFEGIVSERALDSIELSLADGSPLSVSHGDITMLERYVGQRTYKKRGFLIGFGLGAIAGIGVGLATSETCDEVIDIGCEGFGVAVAALGVGVYGGGLGLTGLLIGAAVKTDQWQEIARPSVGSLQLSPMLDVGYSRHSGQQIRIGVSASF